MIFVGCTVLKTRSKAFCYYCKAYRHDRYPVDAFLGIRVINQTGGELDVGGGGSV